MSGERPVRHRSRAARPTFDGDEVRAIGSGVGVAVRRPPPAPTERQHPEHARMLQLQRDAGNAAVGAAFAVAQQVLHQVTAVMFGLQGAMPFDVWHAITSRLVGAAWDLGTAEKLVQAELLQRETARLRAETAAIRAEVDRMADHRAGHPGGRVQERLATLGAIALGETDDVELTDRVFLERHPERAGRPLQPSEPADADLIREWVAIRRTVVRPVLRSELGRIIRTAELRDPAAMPKKAARGSSG